MQRTVKLAVVSLLLATTACSSRAFWTGAGIAGAAAAGAAAVFYAKGDLEADFEQELDEVYAAALETVEERGYRIEDRDIGPEKARIDAIVPSVTTDAEERVPVGDKADPADLKIRIGRKDGLTHISIRVGIMGDEDLSRAVLSDIERNLARRLDDDDADDRLDFEDDVDDEW